MRKLTVSQHSAYMRTWRKLAKDQKKLISVRSRTNVMLRKNAALGRYPTSAVVRGKLLKSLLIGNFQ